MRLTLVVLAIGQVYANRFRILGELARTPTAHVYRVKIDRSDADWALKVVRPTRGERSVWRRRFQRELALAQRLRSEHLVPVHDWGWDEPTLTVFLAMDAVEGFDLERWVRRGGPFGPRRVLDLVRQAGRALEVAHEHRVDGALQPIVHCDLGPRNLLLCPASARLRLIDFGDARWLPGDAALVTTRGTAPYLAPEQLDGAAVSPQTDLWALGLVSFFLLTGLHYFSAPEPRHAILAGAYEAPSQRLARTDRRVPVAYDDWFARCVQRDPARRFGGAAEAVAAFERCLADVKGDLDAPLTPPVSLLSMAQGLVDAEEPHTNPHLEQQLLPAARNVVRVADDLVTASAHYFLHRPDNEAAYALQLRCLRHYIGSYNARSRCWREVRTAPDPFGPGSSPRLVDAWDQLVSPLDELPPRYTKTWPLSGEDVLEQYERKVGEWREHGIVLASVLERVKAALSTLEAIVEQDAENAGRESSEVVELAMGQARALLTNYRTRALDFADAIEHFRSADFTMPEQVSDRAWQRLAPAINELNKAYISLETASLPLRAKLRRAGADADAQELVDLLHDVEAFQWHAVRKELNRLLVSLFTFLYGGHQRRHLDIVAKKRDLWADLADSARDGSEPFDFGVALPPPTPYR